MSTFRVDITATNPRDESRSTPAIEGIVESGSELTWLPGDTLRQAGIEPRRTYPFRTATGEIVERAAGYAILAVGEFECNDEVVFGAPGDAVLLGVRSIEGFGVDVDSIGHRFIRRAFLAV